MLSKGALVVSLEIKISVNAIQSTRTLCFVYSRSSSHVLNTARWFFVKKHEAHTNRENNHRCRSSLVAMWTWSDNCVWNSFQITVYRSSCTYCHQIATFLIGYLIGSIQVHCHWKITNFCKRGKEETVNKGQIIRLNAVNHSRERGRLPIDYGLVTCMDRNQNKLLLVSD